MWADIANWLLANIVNNSQISNSLIALILLIVSVLLISKKPTERNLFRSKNVWGTILAVFSVFMFLFANIADLASVFIAWATIILAGAATLGFEENRRLRNQYAEREERDRKERLLNEITQWADDAIIQILGFTVHSGNIEVDMINLSKKTIALNSKGKYIMGLAEKVFNNKLGKAVKKTASAIGVYGASLRYCSVGGDILIKNATKKQKNMYKEKVDTALALDKKHNNNDGTDTYFGELEERVRDNALEILDTCVELKADLLINKV